MDFMKRAFELNDEIVGNRRYLHSQPEIGMRLPITSSYVFEKLKEYGLNPVRICESTIVVTIGKKEGKVILLRADMDGLPIEEDTKLEFASINGSSHACGHDMHTAMLLGASKMLQENVEKLNGTVKIVFQPGEETFEGAKAMIAAGILENPRVDSSLAYHVGAGVMPIGSYFYNNTNTMMLSNDGFRIKVKGVGAHGAYPHNSVDPINIAAHIYLGLQELIAREVDPSSKCVLTIGSFNSGKAPNVIPEVAILEGTIRNESPKDREFLLKRVKDIVDLTAKAYRGSAEFEILSDVPPLVCNKEFTDEIIKYMHELPIEGIKGYSGIQSSASDDYAEVLSRVPGTYIYLSAGFPGSKNVYQAHNPKVVFNEEVMPIGAAFLAHCATRWLEENK